jgi:hypothetical protein
LANYQHEVRATQDNARAILKTQRTFKIQVQEWKDVLLRGKDPEKFEQYWKSFLQREALVDAESSRLLERLPEGEAKQKLQAFLTTHRKLTDQYRAELATFKRANYDPTAGDNAVTGIDRAPTELLDQAEGCDFGASRRSGYFWRSKCT